MKRKGFGKKEKEFGKIIMRLRNRYNQSLNPANKLL